MSAIDDITNLAQDVNVSLNGRENDDTGSDLTEFQDSFIRAFNLWVKEYETETYWRHAISLDYSVGPATTATTYDVPSEVRTPMFSQGRAVRLVLDDGTVIANFTLVSPDRRRHGAIDDSAGPDRAMFINYDGGGRLVLSRQPRPEERGARIVFDAVMRFPELKRNDTSVLNWLANRQLAVLGVAKNMSLANITKASLSPSFAQKYNNELSKAVAENNATVAPAYIDRDDYGYIRGVW